MTTKRFLRLQIIVIIMFTFTLICNTFSWAARPNVKGGGYMSEANVDGGTLLTNDKTYFTAMELITPEGGYTVNGNECTAVTYAAAIDETTGEVMYDEDGKIIYDYTTEITSFVIDEFEEGTYRYFKTVITNPSDITTNTSLYIDVEYDNQHGSKVSSYSVGTYSPITKEEFIYQGYAPYPVEGKSDPVTGGVLYEARPPLCPIATQVEVSPGTEYIEWYIRNRKLTCTFELISIYLTNN